MILQNFFIFKVKFRISFINYFKRKRIIRLKACCGGVWMFKNMRLVALFDMFLHPSLKMTISFANIARTTTSARENSWHSFESLFSI